LTSIQQNDSDDNISGNKLDYPQEEIDKPTFTYKSKREKKMPEWFDPDIFSDSPLQKSGASVTKRILSSKELKKTAIPAKKKTVNHFKSIKKISQKAKQTNHLAKNTNTPRLATKGARSRVGAKEHL